MEYAIFILIVVNKVKFMWSLKGCIYLMIYWIEKECRFVILVLVYIFAYFFGKFRFFFLGFWLFCDMRNLNYSF